MRLSAISFSSLKMLEFQLKNDFFLFNFDQPLANQDLFFNPTFWQQHHRIIGSAKGRGTTWFLQTADLFGVNTALRHYYRGGLWGKINKDRYRFNDLILIVINISTTR